MILATLHAPETVLAQDSSIQGPVDPAEMESFFDGVMLSNTDAKHIAGAAIVIVKDGEILFSKGYGHVDVERGIPVDPESTIFRVGSVSKLFTWTAVMQLVEQGKLDLDADINTYLDFEIPATYPEPITLKNLMSHTPGFEDSAYEMQAASPEKMIHLGEWLKTHIPARVRPAGIYAAYSNYGTTLAGYIVERVSKMDYNTYITENILSPLDMNHSSPQQPLPSELDAVLSQGYKFTAGHYTSQDFELITTTPAGGISASAADMAHFMIAHLQDGSYGEHQIMKETTTQQMHSRLFTHDPRINGLAYGFFEKEHGGQRILWHGGDTSVFHSQLALLPDENVGFFVSCNNAECGGFPQTIFDAFMDHYYPAADTEMTPTSDFADRAGLVAGRYRSNRMSYTTAQKLTSLFSSDVFHVMDDGTLLLAGANARFMEIDPFVFQQINGENTLVFHPNDDGTVNHATFSGAATALEHVPKWDTPLVNYAVLGLSIMLFLSALLAGTVTALARPEFTLHPQPVLAQSARWVLSGTALVSCLFLVLMVIDFLTLTNNPQLLMTGTIPLGKVWSVVFILVIILTIISLGFTILAWGNGYWGLAGRVHYTLVMLAAGALIWFVNHWNLLRW